MDRLANLCYLSFSLHFRFLAIVRNEVFHVVGQGGQDGGAVLTPLFNVLRTVIPAEGRKLITTAAPRSLIQE